MSNHFFNIFKTCEKNQTIQTEKKHSCHKNKTINQLKTIQIQTAETTCACCFLSNKSQDLTDYINLTSYTHSFAVYFPVTLPLLAYKSDKLQSNQSEYDIKTFNSLTERSPPLNS